MERERGVVVMLDESRREGTKVEMGRSGGVVGRKERAGGRPQRGKEWR